MEKKDVSIIELKAFALENLVAADLSMGIDYVIAATIARAHTHTYELQAASCPNRCVILPHTRIWIKQTIRY